MFIASLCTKVKTLKHPKYPLVDEWIKALWYIYTHKTHSEVLVIKKEVLPYPTAWIDLDGIMLSEISQTEKDRFYMISLIYGI